jgi:hypothetical protein
MVRIIQLFYGSNYPIFKIIVLKFALTVCGLVALRPVGRNDTRPAVVCSVFI